ncbi:MAG: hypothetical protein R3285_05550 [Kiloniellales bacterium]|nr:hypothetical protein [Kiloniellales bacterium]
MPSPQIKAGQQYYAVDGAAKVWQVQEIFGDPSGLRHVRLFNVAAPSELRTFTCAVLSDSRRFRLLSEDPAHGAAIQAPAGRRKLFGRR